MPLVVCAGGLGKVTGSIWTESEAVLFARRCESLGVPRACILIESASHNTGENFRFAHTLLEQRGISPATGICVSKPYMNTRALATGRRQWPEVRWYVGTPRLSFEEYFPGGPPENEIALMVGDLQRLRVYPNWAFRSQPRSRRRSGRPPRAFQKTATTPTLFTHRAFSSFKF